MYVRVCCIVRDSSGVARTRLAGSGASRSCTIFVWVRFVQFMHVGDAAVFVVLCESSDNILHVKFSVW